MMDAIQPEQAGTLAAVSVQQQLCVVVPTFNERDNVLQLFAKLDAALVGVSWEVIFVDDNSPDGTWNVVRDLAQSDTRVRCIRRIGRRGLSGACIEGILASSAPFVAVMDADLQHDETQLPKMLALLQSGEAELVVGSRYVSGGSAESFKSARLGGSMFATVLAQRLLRIGIADPMSGFFMIRRERFEELAPSLSVQGFKILLDIAATARGKLRMVEVPYTFGSRLHGESKLELAGGAGFPWSCRGETDARSGVAALPAVRAGRISGSRRSSDDALCRTEPVRHIIHGSADSGSIYCHDFQFSPEQCTDLS